MGYQRHRSFVDTLGQRIRSDWCLHIVINQLSHQSDDVQTNVLEHPTPRRVLFVYSEACLSIPVSCSIRHLDQISLKKVSVRKGRVLAPLVIIYHTSLTNPIRCGHDVAWSQVAEIARPRRLATFALLLIGGTEQSQGSSSKQEQIQLRRDR